MRIRLSRYIDILIFFVTRFSCVSVVIAIVLLSGYGVTSRAIARSARPPSMPLAASPEKPRRTTVVLDALNAPPVPQPDGSLFEVDTYVRLKLLERLSEKFVVVDRTVQGTQQALRLVPPTGRADPCYFNADELLVEGHPRLRIDLTQAYTIFGAGPMREWLGYFNNTDTPTTRTTSASLWKPQHVFETKLPDYLSMGLELAHEWNFDLLWFASNVKRVPIFAKVVPDIALQGLFGVLQERFEVSASGGTLDLSLDFFVPVNNISLDLYVHRKNILEQALRRAVDGLVDRIVAKLQQHSRLLAKDLGLCGPQRLIGAGSLLGVEHGDLFIKLHDRVLHVAQVRNVYANTSEIVALRTEVLTYEALGVEVQQLPQSTPWMHIRRTADINAVLASLSLMPTSNPGGVHLALTTSSGVTAAGAPLQQGSPDNLTLPNLPVPRWLSSLLWDPLRRTFEGLKNLVLLPYKIYRYAQYNQARAPRDESSSHASPTAPSVGTLSEVDALKNYLGWNDASWARVRASRYPMAIVGTGVDYNHPVLDNAFAPTHVGYDWFAADQKPFDDTGFDTEVATLVRLLLPEQRLLAARFIGAGPWGPYRVGAFFNAVRYAIENHAKIIAVPYKLKIFTDDLTEEFEGLNQQLAQRGSVLLLLTDRSDRFNAARFSNIIGVVNAASHPANDGVDYGGYLASLTAFFARPRNEGAPEYAEEPTTQSLRFNAHRMAVVASIVQQLHSRYSDLPTFLAVVHRHLSVDPDYLFDIKQNIFINTESLE